MNYCDGCSTRGLLNPALRCLAMCSGRTLWVTSPISLHQRGGLRAHSENVRTLTCTSRVQKASSARMSPRLGSSLFTWIPNGGSVSRLFPTGCLRVYGADGWCCFAASGGFCKSRTAAPSSTFIRFYILSIYILYIRATDFSEVFPAVSTRPRSVWSEHTVHHWHPMLCCKLRLNLKKGCVLVWRNNSLTECHCCPFHKLSSG